MPVGKHSTIADENGNSDPEINVAEGMLAGGINDAMRGIMAVNAQHFEDNNNLASTSTVVSDETIYTVTLNSAVETLDELRGFVFIPDAANQWGTVKIIVVGQGKPALVAKQLVNNENRTLSPNDLSVSVPVKVIYNGTNFAAVGMGVASTNYLTQTYIQKHIAPWVDLPLDFFKETGFYFIDDGDVSDGYSIPVDGDGFLTVLGNDSPGSSASQTYRSVDTGNMYTREFDGFAWADWQKLITDTFIANNISNPNLLDNPDFEIDQRQTGNVTGIASNTFISDRWKFISGTGNFNKTSDLITMTGLFQNKFETNNWAGKKVTISVEDPSVDLQVNTGGSVNGTIAAGSGRKSICLTGQNSGSDSGWFYIQAKAGNSVAFSFRNLKVELGEVATSFTPPHPQVELAKCQRHYEIVKFPYLHLGTGDGTHNYRYMGFKIQKATVPTLTNNLTVTTGAAITVAYPDDGGFRFGRTANNSVIIGLAGNVIAETGF